MTPRSIVPSRLRREVKEMMASLLLSMKSYCRFHLPACARSSGWGSWPPVRGQERDRGEKCLLW